MLDIQETPLGHEFVSDDFYVLFGNKNIDSENYSELLNNRLGETFDYQSVDQVHGDGVFIFGKDKPEEREADAVLLTKSSQCGLIKTADCLPVVLINEKTKESAIVHAGWRGVYNEIVLKTLKHFSSLDVNDLKIYIGPHISFHSYQVGGEVIEMFSKKFSFFTEDIHFSKDLLQMGFFKLNLQEVLVSEIETHLQASPVIERSQINTFSHPQFHSFRRDEKVAGRNLNFLVRRK